MLQMKTISKAVVNIATANALAPNRRQGICCTNADLLSISSRYPRCFEGAFTQGLRVLKDQASRVGARKRLACYCGEGYSRPILSLPRIMPWYWSGTRTLAVTILTYYLTIISAVGAIFFFFFLRPIFRRAVRHICIHLKWLDRALSIFVNG